MFILTKDMPSLDSRNYLPVGRVVRGMDAVEKLHQYKFMVNNAKIRSEGLWRQRSWHSIC